MLNTKFGCFDGTSWENLCQQIFKRKYETHGYQQMPASPGDFGIEGFTLTGWAFQCYCPNRQYNQSELHEKIRDKITQDLAKLQTYQEELKTRLGSTKICRWIFVTPEISQNKLHIHARNKEKEVRDWALPFINSDFNIQLYDGDHFIVEINQMRTAAGEALIFDERPPVLSELTGEPEEYEQNINRKCCARLPQNTTRFEQLKQRTIEQFLQADGFFRRIESTSPPAYVKLVRLINEYEEYVIETSITWVGSAEDLTEKIRVGLENRITEELSPDFSQTHSSKVARYMIARWLAICELNYD